MTMVAGIDVGKANLDVSVSGGPVLRFDNTASGITKLRKHLQEHDTTLAVCEPTGGYERLLTSRLRETAIAVHVVHPGRVRAFAKACGYEAKTDPLDAQVLSRYGEVFPEADTWEPETDPQREELRDLLRRRRQFVDQRVQELGRLDKGISAAIAKSTRRHIAWLEKEIARLEKEYQAVLQDNATLAARAALYRTVPGIGPLTAATLVAHLPELGHWDSKALTSLVGLAPWSRDSGKKRGHRAIRGGRGLVRRALYMCAWAVIRHDSEMRRFYDRLRQRGKPGNVAVVAVMHKILLQLNAVARRGTPWVPQDAGPQVLTIPQKRLDFEHGYLTGHYFWWFTSGAASKNEQAVPKLMASATAASKMIFRGKFTVSPSRNWSWWLAFVPAVEQRKGRLE